MLRGLAQAGADVVMHGEQAVLVILVYQMSHSDKLWYARAQQLYLAGLARPDELQAKVEAVEGEFGVECGHSDANVMKPAEIRWPPSCYLCTQASCCFCL